ncbi:hypothetical protein B0H14DRAFT_3642288 [Mycena olivaceomarginata]|nr:hypothetical protein B0H14DRAFT_3642288 [Mycena olivaceomarginata]
MQVSMGEGGSRNGPAPSATDKEQERAVAASAIEHPPLLPWRQSAVAQAWARGEEAARCACTPNERARGKGGCEGTSGSRIGEVPGRRREWRWCKAARKREDLEDDGGLVCGRTQEWVHNVAELQLVQGSGDDDSREAEAELDHVSRVITFPEHGLK